MIWDVAEIERRFVSFNALTLTQHVKSSGTLGRCQDPDGNVFQVRIEVAHQPPIVNSGAYAPVQNRHIHGVVPGRIRFIAMSAQAPKVRPRGCGQYKCRGSPPR